MNIRSGGKSMKKKDIAASLGESEIFEQVTKRQLQKIARKAYVQTYNPDEIIVKEGEPSNKLFYIANGIVTVKKLMSSGKDQVYAHLLSGTTFGEMGILDNQPRSATVSALSEVKLVVFERDDFIEILYRFPGVAIGLARLLGRYLSQSNKRLTRGNKERHIVLVFDLLDTHGAENLTREIAIKLGEDKEKKTVYIEYPEISEKLLEFTKDKLTGNIFRHKSGVDVLVKPNLSFPRETRLALLVDNLLNDYENIVLLVRGNFEEKMSLILDSTDQIIIVGPDDTDKWPEITQFHNKISSQIKHFKTKIFTLLMKREEATPERKNKYQPQPDFEVVFSKETTDNALYSGDLFTYFKPFSEAVEIFVDRLQRSNQIAVFIPTTYDVDKPLDTSKYIDRTLAFLGQRFGGATSEEVKGIWNSNEIGLVGERLYKVHTFATSPDLQKYMGDVIDYMKQMKEDLKQEAMAIEINQRLTLI